MTELNEIYSLVPRTALDGPPIRPEADALGIALIGTGGIARVHLDAIAAIPESARIAAVVDTNRGRAEEAARLYPADKVMIYADWREALRDPAVAAVAICTPPFLHAEMIAGALQAGKHVLCEKPVAGTLATLDRLREVERASGCVCSGVFQLRFGVGARQAKTLLDAGLFGRLTLGLSETLWYRSPAYYNEPWRGTFAGDFGGVATIQAIHTIDLLRSLLGPVESVQAEAGTLVHTTEVEDTLVATLRCANGALGQITATINAQSHRSRLELFGTRLQAVSSESADACTAQPFTLSAAVPADREAAMQLSETIAANASSNLHVDQYLDFCAAIRDRRPPLVNLGECRATLELLAAMYKSARICSRVHLPLANSDPWYSLLPHQISL